MPESLKEKTFRGTVWSAIETFSVQGVSFIFSLIIARILSPSDYGVVGMIGIFTAISQTLINSGFGQALIRKTDRTDVDCSTVFYYNAIVAIILYIIVFFCGPLIAKFYDMPILTSITRVVCLGFVFGAFGAVQSNVLTANLEFKTLAKASLSATLVAGSISLVLAYNGFGVWSLAIQGILYTLVNTCVVWVFSKWRPVWAFSRQSFREMFSFGSKLLASGLLNTIFANINSIVIGKVFKAADLGYYSRAGHFSSFGSTNLTNIIQRVSYPALCTIQDDIPRLREGYRRVLRVAVFVTFPVMIGLAAVSKPLIITLITEKWLFSATLLVPICLSGMWYPVHAINLNLLQVKGRSDIFLRLEIIKKLIYVVQLIVTVPFGLLAMVWGGLVSNMICLIINTYYTGKLINMGYLAQMKDYIPILLLALTMGASVWLTISALHIPTIFQLIIGVVEGIIVYIAGAKLFRFNEFAELISLIRKKKAGSDASAEG